MTIQWLGRLQAKTCRRMFGLMMSFLLLFYTGTVAFAATAGNANSQTKTSDTIVRVAVTDYPNYIEMDEEGNVSGYVYEYLSDLQEYLDWQIQYVRMNYADATDALTDGEIDLLAGNQYTQERGEQWDYSSRSMGDGGSVLCVNADDMRYAYNDFADYGDLTIASIAGSIRIEQAKAKLAQYDVYPTFVEYDTDKACKEALENGDVDAVLMSTIRCEKQYKILARLHTASMYFCTNKYRPELKAQLDAAMEELHLEAPYYEEELTQKYYGTVPTQLAFSQEEQEYIATAGTIKVAVSDDLSVVEYFDEETQSYAGIVPDAFQMLEVISGLKFEFVPREDFKTLSSKVASCEVPLIASVADTYETAELWGVDLTDTYYDNNQSLVVNSSIDNYQSADSVLIVRKGYPIYEKIAEERGYTNVIFADSFVECVEQVHKGKADVTLIPSNSIDSLVDKPYYENLNRYTLPDSYNEYSIGVSQNADPRLLSILNKSLASFTKEQKTELLVQNLMAADEKVTLREFVASHRFGIILAILCVVALFFVIFFRLALVRKRTNRQLQEALEKADAANRIKTDFLSRMSHDMRTPMNGILGLTYLMEEQTDIQMIQKELPQLRETGEFLLQLINDVLDVNRIESGQIELHPRNCDAELLFGSIVDMVSPLMEQKNIDFHYEKINMDWAKIYVDDQRLKQIFTNLLSNAVKFTPKGGRIEFIVERIVGDDRAIRDKIIVRDNGIGISADFMPKLFEPFAQENRNTGNPQIGSGLGLAIVKNLIEMMGGTISVRSEVNKGSEFIILLNMPLAMEYDQSEEKKQQEEVYLPEHLKILLCEDHPLNAQIAIRLLERQGITVTWKENGKLGVEEFAQSEQGEYDAILMDIRMPIMNGLEAAKAIREMDRVDAKTIPIIAMTANAFEEDIQASRSVGINEHLAKPVDPPKLYETLAKYITEENKNEE